MKENTNYPKHHTKWKDSALFSPSDFVDYIGMKKALELRKGILPKSAKVLIVDEWIETGAQIQAAIKLIENEKAVVVGIAAISIDTNPLPQQIRDQYKCHAIWFDM